MIEVKDVLGAKRGYACAPLTGALLKEASPQTEAPHACGDSTGKSLFQNHTIDLNGSVFLQ